MKETEPEALTRDDLVDIITEFYQGMTILESGGNGVMFYSGSVKSGTLADMRRVVGE